MVTSWTQSAGQARVTETRESSGMVWPNSRAQTQPCQVSFSMALAAAGAEMPSAFPSTRSQFELYSSNNSKSSLYLTTRCPVCIYILITSPSSFFFFPFDFCVCVSGRDACWDTFVKYSSSIISIWNILGKLSCKSKALKGLKMDFTFFFLQLLSSCC